MTIPAFPPTFDVAETAIASRCLFHFRASDVSLVPLTGQIPRFSRDLALGCRDSLGVAWGGVKNAPLWEPVDWDGDGKREAMTLLMSTSDRLDYECQWKPKAFGFYHAFRMLDLGYITSGLPLWSISADTTEGSNFRVGANGTVFEIQYASPSGLRTAAVPVAPAGNEDRVELWGYLYADGSVQLWQQVNGGPATNSARSAASSLPARWENGSATCRLRVNSHLSTSHGSWMHRNLKLVPGTPDYATLRRTF